MTDSVHRTVLLNETIEGLLARRNLGEGGNEKLVIVDATFGGGGHSAEICGRYPGIKIIAIDQDQNAWRSAQEKFKDLNCDITFHNTNFKNLTDVLKEEGTKEIDGVVLDLGLSSDQLENSGRGFSFLIDEPLIMTMKDIKDNLPRPEDLTARDIVNTWSEKSLSDIIYGYGEERFSRKIAQGIVDSRKKKKIETTFDLVKIIEGVVPGKYRRGKIHCATKTFQALRIAVNDELGALSIGLIKGFNALRIGGRICVISFHSLEDRIVKKFFKEKAKEGTARLINKKPIIAKSEELKNNRRSRSAKLRILEKI